MSSYLEITNINVLMHGYLHIRLYSKVVEYSLIDVF